MTDRPILFSAPMIKALLAGTKTQTRRIVKPQPDFLQCHSWKGREIYDGEARHWCWKQHDFGDGDAVNANPGREMGRLSPYGFVGDRLWVRETWRTFERPEDGVDGVLYFADGAFVEIPNTRAASDLWLDDHKNGRHGDDWRPSIYMRRWASRITLEVTEVRVQRLQEISEEDAKAEGVTLIGDIGCPCEGPKDDPGPHLPGCRWSHLDVDPDQEPYRASFAVLWDAINGKRAAWATNPWLWCVSFRRLP